MVQKAEKIIYKIGLAPVLGRLHKLFKKMIFKFVCILSELLNVQLGLELLSLHVSKR